MGLPEFEKQIQKKLQEREISPSKASWDRLHAMLEQNEKPKKKLIWLWFSAAAIIIFAGLTAWFGFKNEKVYESPTQNSIVYENSENNTEVNHVEKLTDENERTERISEEKKFTPKNRVIAKKLVEETVKTIESNEPEIKKEFDNSQINSALASQEIRNEKKYISAETLLAWAQDKDTVYPTKTKKIKSQTKIASQQLLNSVEKEIDGEFRENIFERTYKNLKQVKEAIVHRNDQPEQ
jgi:hypothetical protein